MATSQMNGNNRRSTHITRVPSNEKSSYAQHDDLIKYIYDSWNKISQEVERSNTAVYYQDHENQNLKDFEPIDLEAYCNRQDVQNVQQPQHS